MRRLSIMIIALALALASCTNDGGSVATDTIPTFDTIGGDAALDIVFPDAGYDTAPDTLEEDATPNCEKACEAVECGLSGPEDACDCGACEDGYGCTDEGLCTADCGALCEGLECGTAGLEGECECGACKDGYDCSDEGACLGNCETLCEAVECGPAGLDDECECGTCDDENVCTDDACLIDGFCSYIAVDDGAECDDDDPCTTNGCEAGVCVGALVDCDDENYCTDDSCDPETGDCANKPNTLFCDDMDPCTLGDACVEGTCAGTPVDCTCEFDEDCLEFEDGDLCNGTLYCDTSFLPWQCAVAEESVVECPEPEEGPDAACLVPACNPEDGECSFAPDNEGMACEDGDACTVGDTCIEGFCTGGPDANCDDGDVCTDDSCDPLLGCQYLNNIAPCDDGDACTTGDICDDGICDGSGVTDCDDGNPCTHDLCDPLLGCQHVDNGALCDDLNACTVGDTCADGACVPGAPILCDDGEICTDDSCDPVAGCLHADNTAPCDDADACTVGDTCADGACAGGAMTCDDDNPCTDDSCEPDTGCVYTDDDTNACDDENACTLGDHCMAGFCTPLSLDTCDDDNDCTDDSCEPGKGCANVANDENSCSDGNPCTDSDYCANGFCGFAGLTVCDDENVCTDDSCDPEIGCVYAPNMESCEDGNACTDGDECADGACVAGAVVTCDDGELCTTDSCDPDIGCVIANNTVPCNDESVCTLVDACDAGVCVGTGALNCDDANVCTDDSCDPVGGCVHLNNGDSCDDNNTCTEGDTCLDGECTGTGDLDCDDGNPCTKDLCLPEGGCGWEDLVDTPCSDEDPCTEDDTCEEGQCVSGDAVVCDDGNPCTDGVCDSDNDGICVYTPNSAGCTDGNACTDGDHCDGGSCVYLGLAECDDDNPCTTDSCDPIAGCLNTFNDLPCVDGNACTTNDHCQEGSCLGGGALTCDDGNPCTDDSCSPASGCVSTDDNENICDDGNECTVNACQDGSCMTTEILVCGGTCGVCTGDQEQCVDGACVCEPACDGLDCGGDGCGDVCGTCGVDEACDEGVCEQGDDCGTPWLVDAVPYTFTGDTTGAENEYSFGIGECTGVNGARGTGSDDEVFAFTPAIAGYYTITLEPTFDSVLYVVEACDDIATTCLGADDAFGADEEMLELELEADATVYIIVDGWHTSSNLTGAFTLTIGEPCIPDCGGVECGDDGCGHSCGGCVPGESCTDGTCIPVDGDTCTSAEDVTTLGLPYAGDTTDAADDYEISGSACPGGPAWLIGADAPDQAWLFTPATQGLYNILYDHDIDGGLYVVSDCEDLAGTCLGAADVASGDETLDLHLDADVTYYIITDGFDSAGDAGPYELTVSPVGDTCDDPVQVDAVPYSFNGDTTPMGNDHQFGADACEGVDSARGAASRDMVFEFSPELTGVYTIILDPTDFDPVLYVIGDCLDEDGSCLGADDGAGSVADEINVLLTSGETYYIIVDGWSNVSDLYGAFNLTILDPCIPDCAGKECGADGCGFTCDPGCIGSVCGVDGLCVPATTGDTCSSTFQVDALPFVYVGDTTKATDDYFYGATDCPGEASASGENSEDQVFEFTPLVSGVYTVELTAGGDFDSALYIVTDCTDIPASCVEADEDIGTETIITALTAGTAHYIIVDGWGTAQDSGPYTLTIGEPCIPDCGGKDCGEDGCGSVCGTCLPGTLCSDEALCEDIPGDDCATAITVDAIPYSYDGSTVGAVDDYSYSSGVCQGHAGSAGGSSGDQAFEFSPTVDGVYTISLANEFDAALYLVTDCAAVDTACLGASETLGDEELIVSLSTGTTYYIIVDGWSNYSNVTGDYTLSIDEPCTPACDGMDCGDDGCGSTCGTCPAGETCQPDGTCMVLEGDICANAFVVDAIPYSAVGDTTGFGLDYGYSVGACPQEEGGWGDASSDAVYAFTPTDDGAWRVILDAEFDSTVYVVTDCAGVDGTCVGGMDATSTGEEVLEVVLSGSTTYYIIVDGFSNGTNYAGAYTLTIDSLGDTCPLAETITAPATVTADTMGLEDDYGYGAGACPPEQGGWGATAPDRVYAFEPDATGTYTITVTDAIWGATVYVVEDCADVDGTCLGGDEVYGDTPEVVDVALDAGTMYYIIVDGYGGGAAGIFTLDLALTAIPPGDTCSDPFVVDALPYVATGDTTGAASDYGYSVGVCPGETSGWGSAASDQVYSFTPATSGDYVVTLDADFDSTLYVVSDCADVDGTCQGASEEMEIETITLSLTGTETYYIIVDGYGNSSNQFGTYTLTVDTPCAPACDGKDCGDDGCGGSCGDCAPGMICDVAGVCQPDATPGDTCAAPFTVGALPYITTGDTTDAASDYGYSAGACPGETSAWGSGSYDEVYEFTPTTPGDYTITLDADFDSNLYVVTDCADVDGTCLGANEEMDIETLTLTLTGSTAYYIIVDGFGNTSSQHGTYTLTVEAAACVPDCEGLDCGDDGCGGSCGTCAEGTNCSAGACVPVPGDTCGDPLDVDVLPFTATGDTTGATADYGYSAGACPGESAAWGSGASDQAYAFTPAATGDYVITLDADFNSNLYVVSDCADVDGTCLGANEETNIETLTLTLTGTETYYIIVDGYGTSSNQFGTYSLTVEAACVPACDGKDCGDNGCGGSCGDCDPGMICDVAGVCQPNTTPGDTCAAAFEIDALPYTTAGDTDDATSDYGYSAAACPGETSGWGAGSYDEVYGFVPTVTGDYTITLDADFDSNLYVVTDCGDIDGTCLGASEEATVETLTLTLTEQQTYYIIVDGYGNSSNQSGTYALTVVDTVCVPSCGDNVCGDDGCGGSCGSCLPGTTCDAGVCVALQGDTCATAVVIDALPYSVNADTTDAIGDYGYGADACPGEASPWGAGSNDLVYAFTPGGSGDYIITLDADFDSTLYVTTNCAFIDDNCVGADEQADIETLTLSLTGGVPYFIIVDGFGNTSNQYGTFTLTVEADVPLPTLVINEVDYDQVTTDTAEFVEIYNTGTEAVSLADASLTLVNGGVSPATTYMTVDLSTAGAELAAGAYLVAGSSTVVAALPPGVLSVTFAADTNIIQNGGPDGIQLFAGGVQADGLHYEGTMAGVGEGTAGPSDPGNFDGSISRCPNGDDTDDNGADFSFVTPATPGVANSCL